MPSVISFHTHHDANVSITVDGELQVVLELEREYYGLSLSLIDSMIVS